MKDVIFFFLKGREFGYREVFLILFFCVIFNIEIIDIVMVIFY